MSALSHSVGAQTQSSKELEYVLLEPTVLLTEDAEGPLLEDGNLVNNPDFFAYLKIIFNTALVMATVLSVFMIVVAGVEYIASAVPGAKGDAKKRINNALLGLAIALFSWLLLETIDPSLTMLKIDGFN